MCFSSTDASTLQHLLSLESDEGRRQFLSCLLEYRKLAKIKSTYMDPLSAAAEDCSPAPLEPVSHQAIFCSWNQTHAGTGRLSTSLPNLQSLPRGSRTLGEDEDDDDDGDEDDAAAAQAGEGAGRGGAAARESDVAGRAESRVLREVNIRDCFRPSVPGRLFVSADFNQMEMRVMAHCSSDRQLLRFFSSSSARSGSSSGDIYVFMASLCFDKEEAVVSKEERACAKTLSLGIAYGMGRDNMARKLTKFTGRTVSETEARELINRWSTKVTDHTPTALPDQHLLAFPSTVSPGLVVLCSSRV